MNPIPKHNEESEKSAAPAQGQQRDKPLRSWYHCRTGEFVPPGSKRRGLAKDNAVQKIVHTLDYGVSDASLSILRQRFPGVEFLITGMAGHGHPIAHTSTKIGQDLILDRLPSGAKVCDINGNPGTADAYRRRNKNNAAQLDVFCKVLCPKDAVRAKTRWGPRRDGDRVRWEEMSLYDMYRNDENRTRFAQYDTFLMNHVLYYYTMNEIVRLLHLNPDSKLIAMVHKLPGQSGTINGGEQRYEKHLVTGHVTQTDVDTGEFYSHPDPSPWFRNYDYADADGAIAWTVNKVCDDIYTLTITSCPPELVPVEHWLNGRIIRNDVVVNAPVDEEEDTAKPPAYSEATVDLASNQNDFGIMTKPRPVRISHPDLYKSLCHYMINRPRNAKTLQDLTMKAHREVGNNALLGGNTKIKIDPGPLAEHIAAAFVSQGALERDLVTTVLPSARGKFGNYANVVKSGLYTGIAISSIMKSKDPVHKVLLELDSIF